MEKMYLVNCEYENTKSRVISYFSKNPLSKEYDFLHKQKYFPSFTVDISKNIVKEILYEFSKDIKIEYINKITTKVIGKTYDILQKCAKIITQSTSKSILLIEPERQFLISNNWSYYDTFCNILRQNIRKIVDQNLIQKIITIYTENLNNFDKIKLIEPITKRTLLSNLLSIKPQENIRNDQIINILFENHYFKNELTIQNKLELNYNTLSTKIINRLQDIEKSIKFSNKINNNKLYLEKSPQFIQYLTEYSLLNSLFTEIPRFIHNENTKFYVCENKFKSYKTIKRYDLPNTKIKIKKNRFITKVDTYFPKLNLSIPKINIA